MRLTGLITGLMLMLLSGPLMAEAKIVQTPYQESQKVLFDFYLQDPDEIGSALFWLRSFLNPLMQAPYSFAPDFMDLVVLVHGTEIVTLAKKNRKRYEEHVARMEYYADLGVKFKICGLAMEDFGYQPKDLYEFIEVVPSGITELAHWQQQGYAIITPTIRSKRFSIDEIR